MSDTTRASLPELALGSAVLAADAVTGLARRTASRAFATGAQVRGVAAQALDTSRSAAAGTLRSTANAPLAWVETAVIPKVIDDLMPYLLANVIPQVIESIMPEIRANVLPTLIDDLANSPQLRDLITEQSRDVVADAAGELRESTATADDRVESGFRRMFRLSPAQP